MKYQEVQLSNKTCMLIQRRNEIVGKRYICGRNCSSLAEDIRFEFYVDAYPNELFFRMID